MQIFFRLNLINSDTKVSALTTCSVDLWGNRVIHSSKSRNFGHSTFLNVVAHFSKPQLHVENLAFTLPTVQFSVLCCDNAMVLVGLRRKTSLVGIRKRSCHGLNIWFCPHKHGWKMSRHLVRNIQCADIYKHWTEPWSLSWRHQSPQPSDMRASS